MRTWSFAFLVELYAFRGKNLVHFTEDVIYIESNIYFIQKKVFAKRVEQLSISLRLRQAVISYANVVKLTPSV